MRKRLKRQHARIRPWSDEAAEEYGPVRRMMLRERGELVQAVTQLSEHYELRRVDGAYAVVRNGDVVPSIQVRRCQEGVRLLVKVGCAETSS